MSNTIDKILKKIEENGFLSVHKDLPSEYHLAIPKMEAFDLVNYTNNTLKLTKTGYDVIESGGFDKWRNSQNITSEEVIIRDEAREFAKFQIDLSGVKQPVEIFNSINNRLFDFYTETSKSIFLDEIKTTIIELLQKHRDQHHQGNADSECGWELRVEKVLFYINQHKSTLPLVAHPKVKTSKSERNKVFVSYSRKDKKYLDEIKVHFKPFNEKIEFWEDSKIEPGQKWKDEIRIAIDQTKVGILLVSANFLASDFIAENELPPILNAAEKEGAVILTVILKPCAFEHFNDLNQYQTLNPLNNSIAKMNEVEKEEVYVNLVRQTLKVLGN